MKILNRMIWMVAVIYIMASGYLAFGTCCNDFGVVPIYFKIIITAICFLCCYFMIREIAVKTRKDKKVYL